MRYLLNEGYCLNLLAGPGCGSLKANPIADAGAWKAGGYGSCGRSSDRRRLERFCGTLREEGVRHIARE